MAVMAKNARRSDGSGGGGSHNHNRMVFDAIDARTELDNGVVFCGDSAEVLKTFAENSFDSIVCDPPYEIGFMGRKWDGSGIAYSVELWRECLRVLKPGGYLLAFGGTRTYHRMACAIEDAGFDLHPMICWTFGSGFPKATNLSKLIDKDAGVKGEVVSRQKYGCRPGGGRLRKCNLVDAGDGKTPDGRDLETAIAYIEKTKGMVVDVHAPATELSKKMNGWFYGRQSLKPAVEPVCMAQKPPEGRMIDNVAKYGTGAVNVDGCRVETDENNTAARYKYSLCKDQQDGVSGIGYAHKNYGKYKEENSLRANQGRFPANVIHDGSPEVLGEFPEQVSKWGKDTKSGRNWFGCKGFGNNGGGDKYKGDAGSAARFFKQCQYDETDLDDYAGYSQIKYYAKASVKDRDGAKHPTVKPSALIRYLIRLITPPGGTVLDPFGGSGTTGKAAIFEGFRYVMIEREPEYYEFIKARMQMYQARVLSEKETPGYTEKAENPNAQPIEIKPKKVQLSLF